MKLWNIHGQQNNITDTLQLVLPEHAVISVVGAGGKTSLIFAWARELADAGKRVIITTTTHMMHPEYTQDMYSGRSVIYYPGYAADGDALAEDKAQIDALLDEEGILLIASSDAANKRKITAAPAALMKYAFEAADVTLIEADGSRRMPVKLPKEWEPVVPKRTDITVCVAGLSALGRPAEDVMYGYEALPSSLANENTDEALIAFAVSSADGGLKGTYGDYRIFLNQADTEELQESASYIQKLLAVRGMQSAWGMLREE